MIALDAYSYGYDDDLRSGTYTISNLSPNSSTENDTLDLSCNSLIYEELDSIPTDMMDLLASTSYTSDPVSTTPYLTLEGEIKNSLRFRYKSEKGKHGGLKPVIKLHNYEDPIEQVYIQASLYTIDINPVPHVLELSGKQCEEGICWQKLSSDYIAKFPSLSIYTKKKEEIAEILKKRKKMNYKQLRKRVDETLIDQEIKEEMKTLNLASVKLCFQAFNHKKIPLTEKLFSPPISNQKNPIVGELKITRLSNYSGKWSGGDELILLCDRIQKDDIEIHFCEKDCEGNVIWRERGKFNPADVHHQVAIPFKTPPYKENKEATVYIMLYRKSDGKEGEGREFCYIPDHNFEGAPSSKRKRLDSLSDTSISSASTSEVPLNIGSYGTSDLSANDKLFIKLLEEDIENPSSELNLELLRNWGLPNIDEIYGPLKEDTVIPEFSSLTLSTEKEGDTSNGRKTAVDLSKGEEVGKLKECLINFLKNREKKSFLHFIPTLMTVKDENHNTLLHLTIKEKSDDLKMFIRLLHVAPGDLKNKMNKFHQTPLHLAIYKKLWKIVRILLLFGADPNIKDAEGNNCVHLAVKHNLPKCLAEILSPSVSDEYKKCTPCINALNHDGLAPLHLSIINESEICTKLLIEAKANINVTDGKSGKTPLHLAYEQDSKLKEYLLSQSGIDVNALDFTGSPPISKVTSFDENKELKSAKDYMKPYCIDNSSINTKEHVSEPSKIALFEITKPSQCCIEISSEISEEDSSTSASESENLKVIINSEIERKLCEILDSNGQWSKLGAYIMDKNELDIIADLDSAPTQTILNQLKKRHGEKYSEELIYILKGREFKELTKMLKI